MRAYIATRKAATTVSLACLNQPSVMRTIESSDKQSWFRPTGTAEAPAN